MTSPTSDARRVVPITAPFDARIKVPGSRSITNRALVCAALAEGTSRLSGWLDADDTQAMRQGVQSLGADIREESGDLVVDGVGGRVRPPVHAIDCILSGSTIRFLAAVGALVDGWVTLDGSAPLRQRPMQPLLTALEELGARVTSEGGRAPISVCGPLIGGQVALDATTSGQFLSALLLAGPCMREGVRVEVGKVASEPFVEMTRRVMESFGARTARMWTSAAGSVPDRASYIARNTGYRACDYRIEPDVMSASYMFAAAAITRSAVLVEGLSMNVMQGDIAVLHALEMMGARIAEEDDGIRVSGEDLSGITFDLENCIDMAPTLAVVACFADGPTTLTGTANLRVKESDRAEALSAELSKLGARVLVGDDQLTIEPPKHVAAARISTYDDHRIAMAFAVAGLRVDGIEIEDPGCVAKTYPRFFDDLEDLSR